MGKMIEKTIGIMKEMQISEEQIEKTKHFIPGLKRWRR